MGIFLRQNYFIFFRIFEGWFSFVKKDRFTRNKIVIFFAEIKYSQNRCSPWSHECRDLLYIINWVILVSLLTRFAFNCRRCYVLEPLNFIVSIIALVFLNGEAGRISKGDHVISLVIPANIRLLPSLSRTHLNSKQLAAHAVCAYSL